MTNAMIWQKTITMSKMPKFGLLFKTNMAKSKNLSFWNKHQSTCSEMQPFVCIPDRVSKYEVNHKLLRWAILLKALFRVIAFISKCITHFQQWLMRIGLLFTHIQALVFSSHMHNAAYYRPNEDTVQKKYLRMGPPRG